MFTRSKQGAIHVVSGNAALAGTQLDELAAALEECLADGQPKAVLDMSDIALIDSAGLERLLDIQDRFEQRAGALKLAAPNALCQDILAATGVAIHFEVCPDTKSAIGSFLH
jgi:anti-anti-sigma factor